MNAYLGALNAFSIEPSERHLPPFDMRGKKVLDIGCGNGKDLMHPVYAEAVRWGIDPDHRGIEAGRKTFTGINLICGFAESLPFSDAHFDVVTARVSLPYTNIPVALAEITRVLKPGGYLCISIHGWRRYLITLKQVRTLKPAIDMIYVTLASWCYALADWVPPRPWATTTRETYQSATKMRRSLAKLGFRDITIIKTPESAKCFVTAIRA